MMSIEEAIAYAVEKSYYPRRWGSLLINLKKPKTQRVYLDLDDGQRISIHRFDPCELWESFAHPHRWTCGVKVLVGSYKMRMFKVPTLEAELIPEEHFVMDTKCVPGTTYTMTEPCLFHQIAPYEPCLTIMVNHREYPQYHESCVRTAGKNLQVLDLSTKIGMLAQFKALVGRI